MWAAKGWDAAGQEVKVRFFAEVSEGGSRQSIEAAVRDATGGRIPSVLKRELSGEDPVPGIDGIGRWGARAVELVGPPKPGSGLVLLPDTLKTWKGEALPALVWAYGEMPVALVFYFPEAIVADVSGLTEIEISSDSAGTMPLFEPFKRWQMLLEWRAYLGEGTLVCEDETTYGPPDTKRQSVRFRLLGGTALLIARVVGWMGRDEKSSKDRFYRARCEYFEQKHSALAQRYPNLALCTSDSKLFRAKYGAPPTGSVVVFVHGTFSCALPNLVLLDPLPLPTYRFEHDTFQSLATNAEQLVAAIKGYLKPCPVHLLAHSRGGLVALLAACELQKTGFAPTVRTYGTPHLGTPLANMAGRLFNFLISAGRTAAGGVFSWDPPSLAGKLLMKSLLWSPKLPEGLEVMRTDSQVLKTWRFFEKLPFPILSYGGKYDLRTLANGACAYALGEIVDGAFRGQNNDLVVPTSSATAAGTPQPTFASCTHFEYFSNDRIRNEIRELT